MEDDQSLAAFIATVSVGDTLTGTVVEITRSDAAVLLDGFTDEPIGIISSLDLSWSFDRPHHEILHIGDQVTAEVIAVDPQRGQVLLSRAATESTDTTNGEARLSLRATQPDPFQQFARNVHVGQILHAQVTKLVPFGAFARVADGIEGLIHLSELSITPIQAPEQAVQVGDEVTVAVTDIDLARRHLALSRCHGSVPQ